MSVSSPVRNTSLPGKAILGLVISAVLLITAVSLEIYSHFGQDGIAERKPAHPESDPMLQPVAGGARLPSQEELTPPPMAGGSMGLPGMGPGVVDPQDPSLAPPAPGGVPGAGTGPGPVPGPGPGMGEVPVDSEESRIRLGRQLAVRLKCLTCHSEDGRPGISTSFLNLYGNQSLLKDGSKVLVDDGYIRESILDPKAKIVAGPALVMQSYKDQVSEGDIVALTAYIKSLKKDGN